MYHISEKTNKSNLFVRDCITQALFRCLEKNKFEQITVTDIIKKAGVSRMGFYRNYKTKEEVIEDFILNIFVQTVEKLKKEGPLKFNLSDIILTTLKHFKNYSSYIKLFLDQNLDNLLYNCYCKAFYSLYPRKNESIIREYSTQMFIGEIFNLEMTWLKNGMKESPEKLTRIYYSIIKLRIRA